MHPHERFEQLLGFTPYWVPTKPGTKTPAVSYTKRPYDETLGKEYRSLLTDLKGDGGPGLAVYLGAPSQGLRAIDFDVDEHLAAFLALNDRLLTTLQSKGARGAQVWVQIKGECPPSFRCAFYEWRSDKQLSTIYGRHPSGCQYKLLVEAKPIEIDFKEIQWPKGWPSPDTDEKQREFVEKHGEPWIAGKDGGPVRLSQRHFAARLAADSLVFDPDSASFYQYNEETGRWTYRTEDEICGVIGAMVADELKEMVRINAPDMAVAIRKGFTLINHQFCKGAAGQLRGMVAERDRFRKSLGLVHCANGVLDLNDSQVSLKPFNREFWSRNQLPVAYDPKAKCPRYIAELLATQLNEEDQRLWQLCCGQYLLGRNVFQNFLIMTGTAGGGKGTLCKLVTRMIGRGNVGEIRTGQLTSRFELGMYKGKTMLYGPDVEPNFLSTDGAHTLKAMTGGDYMSGEIKGSSVTTELEGDFNVLISCNSRLMARLRGDSAAWARRMLLLHFENPPVAKPIPHFDRQLFDSEGPGILNWMLEGTREIMAAARERRPFPMTTAQRERVTSLLAESDSVREFIRRRLRRSNFLADAVTAEDMYRAYLSLCEENGWQPVSQRVFGLKGDEIMITELRASKDKHIGDDRSKRGWRGVTMITDMDSPESY